MPESALVKIIVEYGLGLGIFIVFFFLLKWVLEEVKKILERDASERAKWLEIIQGFQKCITEHTEKAEFFHKQSQKEHEQMIEVLGRINGYHK